MRCLFLIILLIPFYISETSAQETSVKGKVSDAKTGEPIPFVNVFFKGTTTGSTTDFDGFFEFSTNLPVDTVTASYIGYYPISKPVKRGVSQTVNFKLDEKTFELEAVVIRPGVNPAHRIIRNAQNNRDKNSITNLQAYETESYNKIMLAINNVSKKMKDNRKLKPAIDLFDTIPHLTGDSHKAVLPFFISESVSEFYYQAKPEKTKEIINATKIKGVGIDDGSLVSQIIGSTFQQYNFNTNYVRILEKDFLSPIANNSIAYYIFTLRDSMYINGKKVYKIQVNPKNPLDLVFTGNIWIEDNSFALVRVVVEISNTANLNFVQKLKIQQELEATDDGPWIPFKNRVLIDILPINDNSIGLVAVFYTSHKNIVTNKLHPPKFYNNPIELKETAQLHEEKYWDTVRHEKLTIDEIKVYNLVDSLSKVPIIKTYADIIEVIVEGYYKVGKIDVGPYVFVYGYNSLEGHRVRGGFRTNRDFSEKYVFKGYLAYGFGDQRYKYSAETKYILSRNRWTEIGIKRREDVDQIGITDQEYSASNLFTVVSVFQADQLNRTKENKLWVNSYFKRDWQTSVTLHNKHYLFEKVNDFNFAYITNPESSTKIASSDFTNTSVSIETRFAPNELFVQDENEKISLGNAYSPALKLRYERGLKNVLGGEFDYNRLVFNMRQTVKAGVLGKSTYSLTAGKIFETVPYPLLEVHRGNESFIYWSGVFSLMNFFEFVSDQYVTLDVEHGFEGMLFNRLPAISKWKLRFFANGRAAYGSISEANKNLIPALDEFGRPVSRFFTLENAPYVEWGYGVENIFKFIRIDFIHRTSYLKNPDIKRFGIKTSLRFKF